MWVTLFGWGRSVSNNRRRRRHVHDSKRPPRPTASRGPKILLSTLISALVYEACIVPRSAPMTTAAGLTPVSDLPETELRTDDRLERALDMRDEKELLLSDPPEPITAKQHHHIYSFRTFNFNQTFGSSISPHPQNLLLQRVTFFAVHSVWAQFYASSLGVWCLTPGFGLKLALVPVVSKETFVFRWIKTTRRTRESIQVLVYKTGAGAVVVFWHLNNNTHTHQKKKKKKKKVAPNNKKCRHPQVKVLI